MPTRRPYIVKRPAELAELVSAVRQDIVDTIQTLGPSTVREIAHALGKPADALYYHVKRLAAAGLVVERRSERPTPHAEAVFEVPGAYLKLKYEPADVRNKTMISDIVDGMLRTAGREFRRGFSPALAVPDGPERNLWGNRTRAWLSRRDLAKVHRLMEELIAVMQRGSRREGSQLVSLTCVLSPIEPRPLRATRRNGRKVRGANMTVRKRGR